MAGGQVQRDSRVTEQRPVGEPALVPTPSTSASSWPDKPVPSLLTGAETVTILQAPALFFNISVKNGKIKEYLYLAKKL